jgi:hypothetical protein
MRVRRLAAMPELLHQDVVYHSRQPPGGRYVQCNVMSQPVVGRYAAANVLCPRYGTVGTARSSNNGVQSHTGSGVLGVRNSDWMRPLTGHPVSSDHRAPATARLECKSAWIRVHVAHGSDRRCTNRTLPSQPNIEFGICQEHLGRDWNGSWPADSWSISLRTTAR